MTFFEPNFWAILIAAVVTFIIGALWYTVLFGKVWMRLHGYADNTAEQMAQMQRHARQAYVVSFLAYLAMAAALSLLADYVILVSAAQAIKLALLVFVGFVGPVGLIANRYSDKPLAAWLIDAGYQLLYFIVMSLIVTLWI